MGDELQVTVIATGIEPLSEEVETSKAVVTQFDNIKDAAFKAPSSRPQKEPVAREISPDWGYSFGQAKQKGSRAWAII